MPTGPEPLLLLGFVNRSRWAPDRVADDPGHVAEAAADLRLRVCSERYLSPRMGAVVNSQGRQPLGPFRRPSPLGRAPQGRQSPLSPLRGSWEERGGSALRGRSGAVAPGS